ncbi:hypothetical protein DKM44_14035 [Deinococcus irradiatisoli]|uniref:Uncharacterized protein n=1 Tax=Deinococcus irradiatisoli TaxID=2202254 RepID=A0A2Z3JKY8_9DEIO|nr:hypothetical protein [Deinococcus irradiatisoli]AWN24211.1 hypothetical protein DKM44_14035 [Deinococcus irradiatisoli]
MPWAPIAAAIIGAGAGLFSGYKADKRNQQIQGQMQQTQDRQMSLYDQANSLIPGMQGLMGQYGNANQGFQDLMGQLDGVNGQYGGLLGQIRGLYSQAQNGGPGDGGAAGMLMSNAQGALNDVNPAAFRAQAMLSGNDALGQLGAQMAGRGILSSGATSRLGASTLSRLYANAAAQGQQDRLNAYGISNNAASAAGNLALQGQGQQNSFLQNLLGMQQGVIGAQGQGVLAQGGLLGNYLGGLGQQFGMQQGIANQYNQQAGALGGMYQQQSSQINPNPYGGFGAALGSIGTAVAGYYGNQQQGQYLDWLKGQQGSSMPTYGGYTPYYNPAPATPLPFSTGGGLLGPRSQ